MKKIVIQGLGYVGLAMLAFCAGAKRKDKYLYKVIRSKKFSKRGQKIVQKINSNQIPILVDDKNFKNFYNKLSKKKSNQSNIG